MFFTPSTFSLKGRIISRQNLNGYLETLQLISMQLCELTGFYRKICRTVTKHKAIAIEANGVRATSISATFKFLPDIAVS